MEQHQFRVSLSVGTKLLISVTLLIVSVILFFNVSTILLITEDKRAYTYQSQNTEALLLGRQFVSHVTGIAGTLRISLANANLFKPLIDREKEAVRGIVHNQTDVKSIALGLMLPRGNGQDLSWQELFSNSTAETLATSFPIRDEQWANVTPRLLQSGYAYLNVSVPGGPPILVILMSDVRYRNDPKGLPTAIAWVALDFITSEKTSSQVTIADRDGWILYDTEPANYFQKPNVADDPLFETAVSSVTASGANEFEYSGEKQLGSFIRPGFDTVVMAKTPWKVAMRATYTLAERYFLLALMATSVSIIYALVFARTMTRPLNRLYEATKEVAAGNFNVLLKPEGRDEIAALTQSFVVMSRKIQELIQESIRKVHLENELAIASTVQQTLIPKPGHVNDEVEVYSHYQSAAECGGDWWGYFSTNRKMCVMIADATGHGLPSALITAAANSYFSIMGKLATEDPQFSFSPGGMLDYGNRAIFDSAHGSVMMTFFVAVFDFETMKLTYSSAGHNPPWLFRFSEAGYKLKSLTSAAQRLGESIATPPYEDIEVDFTPGDILFLYTDGVMEGKNLSDEMYGKKRVKKVVESMLESGTKAMIEKLAVEFMEFNTHEKPLDDDVTLAAIRVRIPGAPEPDWWIESQRLQAENAVAQTVDNVELPIEQSSTVAENAESMFVPPPVTSELPQPPESGGLV